jgi:hypothetical protein
LLGRDEKARGRQLFIGARNKRWGFDWGGSKLAVHIRTGIHE